MSLCVGKHTLLRLNSRAVNAHNHRRTRARVPHCTCLADGLHRVPYDGAEALGGAQKLHELYEHSCVGLWHTQTHTRVSAATHRDGRVEEHYSHKEDPGLA
jgi:hypothetical protein